ncbi:MAG: CPBP family intramembrane glutamic endopeptidase [Myxococcota bacterium]
MVPLTLPRAVGAVLAQTLVVAAAFAIAFGLLADDDPFDGSLRDFVLVIAINLVNGAVVLGGALRGVSWTALGWGPPRDVGRTVVLGAVGALLAAAIVAGVGLALGGLDGLRETVGGFLTMPVKTRLLCVLIGLGAALMEETVFRGGLQPVLVARLGRPLGVAVTAVVFSAYHLRFAPIGFVVKVLYGLLYGALRETTGRNWAPALAHLGVWTIVGFA